MAAAARTTYRIAPRETPETLARTLAEEVLGIDRPDDYIHVTNAIDAGFESGSVSRLAARFDVAVGDLLEVIDISSSTFARRKKSGRRLTSDESDRLYRVTRLFARAVGVFGDEEEARRWMRTPKRALGGERPLQMASTDPGAREVEDLLGRIEHGIPS